MKYPLLSPVALFNDGEFYSGSTCTHLGAVMFKFLPLMNWMLGRKLHPTSPKATRCVVSNNLVSCMFFWCGSLLIAGVVWL